MCKKAGAKKFFKKRRWEISNKEKARTQRITNSLSQNELTFSRVFVIPVGPKFDESRLVLTHEEARFYIAELILGFNLCIE